MRLFPVKYRWMWISVGAAVVTFALGVLASSRAEDRMKKQPPARALAATLGEWDTDPAVWGRYFPREYRSWLEGDREDIGYGPGRTKWGGMDGRLRRVPPQDSRALFEGYALSEDREREPSLAAYRDKHLHPALSCLDCHDPRTLDLRVSRKHFGEAMARRGIDVTRASHQEMRSYVCAQCHASFGLWAAAEPGASSMSVDDILGAAKAGNVQDWTHPRSGAPMLRLRPSEFELWSQGIHAYRQVTCADCHMPCIREGGVNITSHRLKSPLLGDLLTGCGVCHRWGERELRDRVEAIQDKTMQLQVRAEAAILAAHRAAAASLKAGVPDTRLKEVRTLIREAQARWDFVASEGSTGFHAPQEAARILGIAIDQGRQAEGLALQLRLPPDTAHGSRE